MRSKGREKGRIKKHEAPGRESVPPAYFTAHLIDNELKYLSPNCRGGLP